MQIYYFYLNLQQFKNKKQKFNLTFAAEISLKTRF